MRGLTGRCGSAPHAAGEPVAELGAAFALAAPGLATEPRPDHARYVARRLDPLRADRRAVFAAASKAQAAAEAIPRATRTSRSCLKASRPRQASLLQR